MTAEVALALPGLMVVVFALVVGVVLAGQQLRCHDAASAVARAVARGEPPDAVRRLALDAMPSGAEYSVDVVDQTVRVHVEWRLPAAAGPASRFAPAAAADAAAEVES